MRAGEKVWGFWTTALVRWHRAGFRCYWRSAICIPAVAPYSWYWQTWSASRRVLLHAFLRARGGHSLRSPEYDPNVKDPQPADPAQVVADDIEGKWEKVLEAEGNANSA
jgi:hypothetical protein